MFLQEQSESGIRSHRGIPTSTRGARPKGTEGGSREEAREARRNGTYLCALQSRSIRMSSSEDSAAAGAVAEAEHIPLPRRARAAAIPALRRASAVAAMLESPPQARARLVEWNGGLARWSRTDSQLHGRAKLQHGQGQEPN
ncbi:hypothetical protein PR202_ga12803 [Eleusine coracana subsp. coracana]|uniref:Uncharacterized protein n=1 Tax=Eleusine coracana subsp. coracana TaxID=191504 RepID=A0AAV5CD54_ELECO|nr:hypothetical protein PR202_ga12803 [Eleusine coracana subsp. coracana]